MVIDMIRHSLLSGILTFLKNKGGRPVLRGVVWRVDLNVDTI